MWYKLFNLLFRPTKNLVENICANGKFSFVYLYVCVLWVVVYASLLPGRCLYEMLELFHGRS